MDKDILIKIQKKTLRLKIIGASLALIGLSMITYLYDWKLSLGIFLTLYGSNLEYSSRIIKTIVETAVNKIPSGDKHN